jgi:hypothetical protein
MVSSMETTPCASIRYPHVIERQVGFHELIILPSELLEDGVRHQVDGSAIVDKHPRDWLPVDVTPNRQRL